MIKLLKNFTKARQVRPDEFNRNMKLIEDFVNYLHTKEAIEASLTGEITSHTHDYMPRTGDSLADGTDLNTLYGSGKSGSYYLLSSYTYTNSPTTFGVLIVDSVANGYTRQEVVRSGLKKERYRNTTTWSDWVDVKTSSSGTFTPVVIGSTAAGTGTYTTQSGTYIKIGNMIYVTIALVWTAHTGTGDLRISGLPFTSNARHGLTLSYINGLAFNYQLAAFTISGSSTISLLGINGGGSGAYVNVDTAATVYLSGWYTTNE